MKIKIIKILILLFFISCNEHKETDPIPQIDITSGIERKEKVNLSEIATHIEYVQLESNETSLLDRIDTPKKDVQFVDEYVLIKDVSNRLFLFYRSGAFIRNIGNLGRGPEEYADIENFTFFNENQLIAIHSSSKQKVFVYSLDGQFVSSFDIGFWPLGLTNFQNEFVFLNNIGRRSLTDYYSLSFFSAKGSLQRRLLYKGNEKRYEKTKKLGIKTLNMNSFVLNDTLRHWEGNYGTDTIWSITKKHETIPSYTINFDSNLKKIDFFQENKQIGFNEMTKNSSLTDYQESTRFLFFELYYAKDGRLRKIVYDKTSNESASVQYKREFKQGFHFSFYNDIDGGMPFWPQGKTSDDKMYMIVHGYELKDYIAKKGADFDAIDKAGRNKLLKLIGESKISDNPILMIVTLKDK